LILRLEVKLEKCEGGAPPSVLPNTAGLWNGSERRAGSFSGDLRDRHAAMSELRVQLHRNLSHRRAGPGQDSPGRLRQLPIQPLVLEHLLAPSAQLTAESEFILLVRLIVAGALGGILGWERESAHKSAGLRTHMLVGIASALFTVLGELAMTAPPGSPDQWRADPVRVIQAVAIGIGFLGTGVIFVAKEGDRVLGLTTAASIWATAGVGIAAGSGRYVLAAGSTLLLVLVLRGLSRFDRDH
jgi:putative Mg2+ transporter-C (MgtC) family protein